MSGASKGGLIRHTLLYMPAQVLGPLLQFATTVIWTHQLDPVSYGVVTFIVAAQELSGFVGLMWWTLYVQRFAARHEKLGSDAELQAMDARMVAFSALAQCLFAIPIVLSFQQGDPRLYLVAALYLVLRTLLMHYGEWARAQHKIKLYTAAQLIGPALGAALSMVFIHWTGGGAVEGLAGLAAGQALGLAVVLRGLAPSFALAPVGRDLAVSALRFGLPLIGAAIATWVAANGIRLLVQWSEGNEAVGLLSVGWGLGQRIANVLAMLCAAAAFPLAVRQMETGDRAGAIGQVGLNGVLMFGIIAPAAVGVSLLARPLVDLLIAETYREATIVILPLAFVAMGVKTIKIHTIDQTGLLLERSLTVMRLNAIEAACTLAGCAAGLLAGGVTGAAAGSLAGVIAGAVVAFAHGVRRMDLCFPLGLLARISMACGFMAALLLLAPRPQGFGALVATIIAGATAYALALIAVLPDLRRLLRERILKS